MGHLFESRGDCCNAWFNDQNVTECELNIIQTIDGYPIDEEPSEWWPTLAYPYDCTSEGSPPAWMLSPGYTSYYIFDSKADFVPLTIAPMWLICSTKQSTEQSRFVEIIETTLLSVIYLIYLSNKIKGV